MQKISLIHKLILKIKQILGYHKLVDHTQRKIIEITFSFPEYAAPFNKSVHSIYQAQSILESCDQICHTYFFTMPTQKIFDQILMYVNLYQHGKNQAISFVLEILLRTF